jgi:hypothetical protein
MTDDMEEPCFVQPEESLSPRGAALAELDVVKACKKELELLKKGGISNRVSF